MRDLFGHAPTCADIERIARAVIAKIPEALRRRFADVPVLVVEFPDQETMAAMDLESPFDLLGLYQGVSLDQKSVFESPDDIDRIFLYRRPLLDYWCAGDDLFEAVIANTVIHEIGHHFGFSDDDMERIEAGLETDVTA